MTSTIIEGDRIVQKDILINKLMATRKPTAPAPAPKKGAGFNAKSYERPGLTEEEVIEIKEAFDLFDTDGGGSIDPKGTSRVRQS